MFSEKQKIPGYPEEMFRARKDQDKRSRTIQTNGLAGNYKESYLEDLVTKYLQLEIDI